ncbi:relaxase/mobilization nuclease domain-containing protein [Parafilimonas sp.]|uniref:relaxase/mobilization nuclease domain-containing protein n=1 Tax=Parafilimonas sp. TaxID=1969739 RepID=UPI003F7E3E1D
MVAVIKSSASIRNVLQYNENKLKQNVAQLIYSKNYGKDTEQLGFTDKIRTLEKIISLNERTKLNAVHISLNFDPSEKLDKETLQKIADAYMQRIGFGNQPYLVYQHRDAGHPHVHLVTTNIQRDGKRIRMQNIGRNQSEKARKEIEKEFKLVQAEAHHLKQAYEIKPVNVQKVQYGKSDTRRAITNVLDAVLPTYKYASLPELNAVLKQYNIVADRGKEGSRLYNSKGLMYRILNDKGEKIGIPIKASQIYNKPTLKFLQQKFLQNQTEKQRYKLRVKNAIDFSFAKQPKQSLQGLMTALQKERIQLVLRQNDKGIIYGLTYIDHQTKCVLNGSDLGKPYSANQIQERCRQQEIKYDEQKLVQQPALKQANEQKQSAPTTAEEAGAALKMTGIKEVFKELTQTEQEGPLAAELRNDELRRKRRKKLHY